MGQRVDKASDIYSFALVAFEIFSGQAPFSSENPAELLLMRINAKIPRLDANPKAGLPKKLDDLLERAAAIKVTDRVDSFLEILSELKEIEKEIKPGKYVWRKKRAPLALTSAALLLSLAFGLGIAIACVGGIIPAMQSMETPSQAQDSAKECLRFLMRTGSESSACAFADDFCKSKIFKSWSKVKQADLYFMFFHELKTLSNPKPANKYLVQYLRTALPAHANADWNNKEYCQQIEEIENYLISEKRDTTTEWAALNLLLVDNDKNEQYFLSRDCKAKILLSELRLESMIRQSHKPPVEDVKLYARLMVDMSDIASKFGLDSLSARFLDNAMETSKQYEIKSTEAYAYSQASQKALKLGKLDESLKFMNKCTETLAANQSSDEHEDLRPELEASTLETHSKIEQKLAERALGCNCKAEALKHKQLSAELLAKAKLLLKKEAQDHKTQDEFLSHLRKDQLMEGFGN